VRQIGAGAGTVNKLVVLTFDDGFRDFYTQACPMLKQYGFFATVFLPTALIDDGRKSLKGKDHLSGEDVRDLHNNGVAFGSHTVTHLQLRILQKHEIEYEIKWSKEVIEDMIGQRVESFSPP
jgi:peptidoglycan/xylan/chitin deacetylase (PgdA/CDA1 family)